MYADHTSVLLSGGDLKDLTCLLNKELELLFIWLKSNKLSLNTQKTFYMLFHRARIKGNNLVVKINDSVLNRVNNMKYLGVIIDHKLKGCEHISFCGISADSPVLSGVPQGTVLGPLLFLIMIADINKDISESNLISFADDTRIYTKILDVSDCNLLQQDLNHIYDWATTNNMFFNAQKFHYITFSSKESSCLSNVYINPELNIINPSSEVLDLGVYMSSNCTFDFHVSCVYKRCSNLSGWILRTFSTRETRTMMTLFKSLVLSRLDYASQLWSPHLLKSVYLLEKVQRSFTKHNAGMHTMSYEERLKHLNLYSIQRRRDRYQIIYLWKIIEKIVPNLSAPNYMYNTQNVEADPAQYCMSTWDD